MPFNYWVPNRVSLIQDIEREQRKTRELEQSQQQPWWQGPLSAYAQMQAPLWQPFLSPTFQKALYGAGEPFRQWGMMATRGLGIIGTTPEEKELFSRRVQGAFESNKQYLERMEREGLEPMRGQFEVPSATELKGAPSQIAGWMGEQLPGAKGTVRREYEALPWHTKLLAEAPAYISAGAAIGAIPVKGVPISQWEAKGMNWLWGKTIGPKWARYTLSRKMALFKKSPEYQGFQSGWQKHYGANMPAELEKDIFGVWNLWKSGGTAEKIAAEGAWRTTFSNIKSGRYGFPPEPPAPAPVRGVIPAWAGGTAGQKGLLPAKLPLTGPELTPEITSLASGGATKLINVLTGVPKALRVTKVLRHEELQARVAAAGEALAKGKGREAFLKSQRYLAGKMPEAPLASQAELTKKELTAMYDYVRLSDLGYFEKKHLQEALDRVLMEQRTPTPSQYKLLKKAFGQDFVQATNKLMTRGEKAKGIILDVLNAPRAILASGFDQSAILRQCLLEFINHPVRGFKLLPKIFKGYVSDKNAIAIDGELRSLEYEGVNTFDHSQQTGLFHAPLPVEEAPRAAREEIYMVGESAVGRALRKIPMIRVSERGFITATNAFRQYEYHDFFKKWIDKVPEGTFKSYAFLLNASTGRGSLGKYSQLGPLLSTFLFSPRYLLGRLQFPTLLFSRDPVVRKEAWKRFIKLMGTGIGILYLADKIPGVETEIDPRSADFGKIKIGKTRLDIWTGYIQFARFIVQVSIAERKYENGQITKVERDRIIQNFARTKESPFVGFLHDLIAGTTYVGQEIELTTESAIQQAYNRLTPMWIADIIDGIREEGLRGGLISLWGYFGVGVMTYKDRYFRRPTREGREKRETREGR